MNASKLYEKYDLPELEKMMREVSDDPANKATDGGIFIYTAQARKKLDAITWAITYHLRDKNKSEKKDWGYTGRQTNRR